MKIDPAKSTFQTPSPVALNNLYLYYQNCAIRSYENSLKDKPKESA